MIPFERDAIGEILERLDKYKFAQSQQQEGESMDTFLADLRILIIIILVLPPAVVYICPSNCALPMSGTVDGDVVSRCQVLGEQPESIMGQTIRCCMVCLIPLSHRFLVRWKIPTSTCSLLTSQPVYATG